MQAPKNATIKAVPADVCIVDGRLDETFWEKSFWIELGGSNYSQLQGKNKPLIQKAYAAVAWNEQGIFIAMRTEDSDVQGNKTQTNDWIWLEDVLEVFLAPSNQPSVRHAEFQVNPSGTEYFNLQACTSTIPQKTVITNIPHKCSVHFDGTLNDSSRIDKGFSAEWFFAWEDLKRGGLLRKNFMPVQNEISCYIRFAAWDLSVYTPLRINRWTLPGTSNPHETQYYMPIILVAQFD